MYPAELHAWAVRHGITYAALAELSGLLGVGTVPDAASAGSEGRVQSQVRLAAPALGFRLFRNNVGVLKDERGVPVRYGLANDSSQMNRRLKSSDLIGWRRVQIGGQIIAQFVAIECKRADWTYSADEREEAQQRWLALVVADGGYARFVTRAGDL